MPIVRIDSADDPRVAEYRGVSDPELIRTRGLFIAEGRLVVERLLNRGQFRIRSLLLSDAAHRALSLVLDVLPPDVPVYLCDRSRFPAVTGFNIHRGCLALVERPVVQCPSRMLLGARLVVVLEGVTNADNVGSVFRSAAAFGVDAVLLSPTACDPLYRKAIRTSMGWTLRVPFARLEPWPGALALLKEQGFWIAALTPRPPSSTLEAFAEQPRPEKLALLVGNEGCGLSEAAEAVADERVRVSIDPAVDSLNLAVAAAIALSRVSRVSSLPREERTAS